jgi:vacuolar protein sorting-associated protein 26
MLDNAALISGIKAYKFSFSKLSFPVDSYEGTNGRVRYYLHATLLRTSSIFHASKDLEILARVTQTPQQITTTYPDSNNSVQLEVGIEDCLHITFTFDKVCLSLQDIFTGRVDFLLVKIRIKHAELAIIRRETISTPTSQPSNSNNPKAPLSTTDTETLVRYEIMDGCPIRGETIPIRFHLSGVDSLTSTINGAAGILTVKYFANIVLVDEEDRRYFKQHEVSLYRKN